MVPFVDINSPQSKSVGNITQTQIERCKQLPMKKKKKKYFNWYLTVLHWCQKNLGFV